MCQYCEITPSGKYVSKTTSDVGSDIILVNCADECISIDDESIQYIRKYSNEYRDRYYLITEPYDKCTSSLMVEIFFCPMCGRELSSEQSKIIPFRKDKNYAE